MRHHNKHIRYFIGGIFAGLGNVVGSVVNSEAQKEMNEKNLQAQIKENQKNRDWQEKMYNQYESPQAQAQQMQSTGINPYLQGNVSTQSVGTASTSALPQGQTPDIGSGIAAGIASLGELPTAIEQFKQLKTKTKSDEQLLEKQSLEIQSMQYDLYMKSIDAGDYETAHQIKMDTLRESYEFQKASRREKQQLVANAEQAHSLLVEQTRRQKLDNDMFEDAVGDGVNSYKDDHELAIARIDEIRQSIINQQTQNEADKFALHLSQLFDERFLNLDYQAREQEVREFLSTSDERVYMHHLQNELMKLAKNEADRNDALSRINNQVELQIAQNILNAAKDGGSSLDAVLLKYFASNPASSLNSILSLVGTIKPNITNKNTYVTYK